MSASTIGLALIAVAAWAIIAVPLLVREERRQRRRDQQQQRQARDVAELATEVRQLRSVLDYLHTTLTNQTTETPGVRRDLRVVPEPDPAPQTPNLTEQPTAGPSVERRLLSLSIAALIAIGLLGLATYCTAEQPPTSSESDLSTSDAETR